MKACLKVMHILGVLLLCGSLAGCSVGMALSGKKEPQITNLQKGMDISQAHFILRDYTPAVTTTPEGERIEAYEIQIGNSPSGGRALGHAVMDVLTFGGWEIIGTPIEAASSKTTALTITYKEEKIVKIQAGKSEGGI
ncbi:MAG: hypothetical protein P9M04_02925 [Candidatus Orphnella occulta]|nr:hypothetical protein [Candidatus Orphnella occulta]